MKIRIEVEGLPPKKDGANSMWRKSSEVLRLRALRVAAAKCMGDMPPIDSEIKMTLCVYALPGMGDLDNFITGICDGLMAVHPLTPIGSIFWMDVPENVRPAHPICFRDDALICHITAVRLLPKKEGNSYFVELEW